MPQSLLRKLPSICILAHFLLNCKRATQDVARLQAEIQQLNDTVFSKSFKPPSAWADREVKYKAEKRDWEHQAANLNEQIKRLTAENEAYRDSNKAAEFEEKIKVASPGRMAESRLCSEP